MNDKCGEENLKWQAIAQDYQDQSKTVSEICRHHKLKRSELYKYAKEHNWQLRSKSKQPKRQAKRPRGVEPKQIKNHKRLQTSLPQNPVPTLQEALEFITMDLMRRIQQRSQQCDADHDKDARTLSSLVRTYEKLKEIESQKQSSNKKAEQKHSPRNKADEDAKRREIATNLEKLIQGL